jgi:hypothetical protein
MPFKQLLLSHRGNALAVSFNSPARALDVWKCDGGRWNTSSNSITNGAALVALAPAAIAMSVTAWRYA